MGAVGIGKMEPRGQGRLLAWLMALEVGLWVVSLVVGLDVSMNERVRKDTRDIIPPFASLFWVHAYLLAVWEEGRKLSRVPHCVKCVESQQKRVSSTIL